MCHCKACDVVLGEGAREREEFCHTCNRIITLLVLDEVEELIEVPFGLYEDWEEEEKADEEDELL